MRITAKQALLMTQKTDPEDRLARVFEVITESAKEGRYSIKVTNWRLTEDEKHWFEINGYDVFEKGETHLISWEYAAV